MRSPESVDRPYTRAGAGSAVVQPSPERTRGAQPPEPEAHASGSSRQSEAEDAAAERFAATGEKPSLRPHAEHAGQPSPGAHPARETDPHARERGSRARLLDPDREGADAVPESQP